MRPLRLAVVALVALLTVLAPAHGLEVGQKAPDFKLPAAGGKQVTLAELTAQGPVVLYTFIQAFTGT